MSEKHQEDKQLVESPYLYFSYYISRFGEIYILFLEYFSLRFMFGYKSMKCFLLLIYLFSSHQMERRVKHF